MEFRKLREINKTLIVVLDSKLLLIREFNQRVRLVKENGREVRFRGD